MRLFDSFRLVATAEPAASGAASAPTTPASSTESAATTGSGPCFLGPSFIHIDRARTELCTIHPADGFLCVFIIGHLYKPEAARLSGVAVLQNGNVIYLAISGKCLAQVVLSDFEIEIPYINIHRASFFGEYRSRGQRA